MLGSMLKGLKMAFGFKRADLPELPPPEFRDPTPPPGWTIQYFPSEMALADWARSNGIADNGHKFFLGGTAPHIQTVGLLQPGLLRDDTRENYVKIHEIGGHANELQHDEHGRGWGYRAPDGAYTPVTTRADLAAAKADYARRSLTFDWAKVLPQGASETAATVPPRGAR